MEKIIIIKGDLLSRITTKHNNINRKVVDKFMSFTQQHIIYYDQYYMFIHHYRKSATHQKIFSLFYYFSILFFYPDMTKIKYI